VRAKPAEDGARETPDAYRTLSRGKGRSKNFGFYRPGIRTHPGNDWYFLAGLPTPLTKARTADLTFDGGPGNNTLVINGFSAPGTIFITQPPSISPFGLGAVTGGPMGVGQVTGRQVVTYSNTQTIMINDPVAVNAEAGPDTRDRATAFAGLNPQERAVQALYLAALGRAGSTAELDGWVTLLPAGATSLSAQVVSGIETSFEARDHLVGGWYLAYLGRPANGTEELGWVNELGTGASEEKVLGEILGDPLNHEFYDRAQARIPSGTADERYVEALYEVLLNRPGEPAGAAGWVAAVPALGRQQVALGFLQAPEFRADQFEGYYNALLHRPDDPALTVWIASALDIRTGRINFESGAEFFANG
jgi:hypothetical protein